MRLRSIEIIGFKSFRTRCRLDVASGVTAIVGPNGCGKSNVVDAVRWALGSQSPRDLRGRTMDDVIFGGSETHRPVGVAEVTLHFHNDVGRAPPPWTDIAEIAVTRRLFRTGESEYEINGSRARLRDIQDVFLGSGVGAREAYSIIEQGRVGAIVSARPEDRRTVIEEAAGVTRYRHQRRTAVRRLEETAANLARVRDVFAEVNRQTASLERQANRLRTWISLTDQALALESELLDAERSSLRAERGRWEARRTPLVDDGNRVRGELARQRERQELARAALLQRTAEVERATEAMHAIQRELDEAEARAHHLEQLEETRRAEIERATSARDQIAERRRRLLAERDETDARLSELVEQAEIQSERHRETDARRAAARERASERERGAREQQREIDAARADAERWQARRESWTHEHERLETQRAASETAMDALASQLEALERAREDAVLASARLQARLDSAGVAVEAARAERDRCAAERRASAEVRLRAREACTTAERRVHALRAELLALRAEQEGGTAVLRAVEEGRLPVPRTPVLERLRVDDVARDAVAAALGPWLSAWIVEDGSAQDIWVAWARAERRAIAVGVDEELRDGRLAEGVLAVAPVPGAVAARLAAMDPGPSGHLRIELDGTIRASDGLVQVPGESLRAASARLERVDELERTQQRLPELQRAVEEAELRWSRAEGAWHEAEALESAAREELDVARGASSAAERELADLHERTAALLSRREAEATGRVSIDARLANLLERIAEASRMKRQADDLWKAGLEAVTALEQQAEEARRDATAWERRATEERIEDVRIEERRVAVQADVLRVREESAALEERLLELDAVIDGAADERLRWAQERTELLRKARGLRPNVDASKAAVEEARAAWARTQRELDDRHEQSAALQARLDDIQAKLQEVAVDQERLAARARAIDERLERHRERRSARESLETPPEDRLGAPRKPTAGGPAEADALHVRLAEVEARLARLGPIDPDAVRAFEEANARAEFLRAQVDDLERASHDLEVAIRKLDRMSREQFLEMFEAVSEQFERLFPRLFGGGRARLELTDPDDLLSSGVEILVQPPGKRLQSMSLLSGGEKALSAVALIFSIFVLRPTPFCVLDEVDAPLDDGNVARFADLVREMSSDSQFLVITHNRTTMAAADVLYGVTMEEPGVSRVVGVRVGGGGDGPRAS